MGTFFIILKKLKNLKNKYFSRKFGQNPNKDHHKVVNSRQELEAISNSPEFTTKEVKFIDEALHTLLVVYENADDSQHTENFRTNVVLASFITMWARMWLYDLLFKVDSNKDSELLYFDTVNN